MYKLMDTISPRINTFQSLNAFIQFDDEIAESSNPGYYWNSESKFLLSYWTDDEDENNFLEEQPIQLKKTNFKILWIKIEFFWKQRRNEEKQKLLVFSYILVVCSYFWDFMCIKHCSEYIS